MDVVLICCGWMLLALGLIGCFVPLIPGPPVAFCSLLVPRMGLTAVAWASLAGWLCMLLLEVPYLRSMRVRGVG